VIRASVPKLDLDDAFEQKNEIAKAVEEELEKVFFCYKLYLLIRRAVYLFNFESSQQAMSAYGYEIVQTLITDIEPDQHVKKAMNEINAGIFLRP